MFDKIEQARLSELHFKVDDSSELKAIIAIHSTKLGPSLGGCRCIEYDSDEAAIDDVIRLARGMSYKAALAKVPQGGGKAVILKPREIADRGALYRAFGKFVNELGGRYITAVDSGTTLDDMDQVARVTPFCSGSHGDGLDPSPMTALGVLAGMKAAAYHKFGNADLSGRIIAIQGVGNVGFALAELLHKEGARLLVSDIDLVKVESVHRTFGAEPITAEHYFDSECDILAPCGLGGVLNDTTIPNLRCKVIAGSANNQLAEPRHGLQLHEMGILYAPDYVLNAGGLIKVSLGHLNKTQQTIKTKTWGIGETLLHIFERSKDEDLPPSLIADQMAEDILYS